MAGCKALGHLLQRHIEIGVTVFGDGRGDHWKIATILLQVAGQHLGQPLPVGPVGAVAVYRYFESCDALLTALVTDAYTALGTTVEDAVSGPRTTGPSPPPPHLAGLSGASADGNLRA